MIRTLKGVQILTVVKGSKLLVRTAAEAPDAITSAVRKIGSSESSRILLP